MSTDQRARNFFVLVYISGQCTLKLIPLTLWRLRHAVSAPIVCLRVSASQSCSSCSCLLLQWPREHGISSMLLCHWHVDYRFFQDWEASVALSVLPYIPRLDGAVSSLSAHVHRPHCWASIETAESQEICRRGAQVLLPGAHNPLPSLFGQLSGCVHSTAAKMTTSHHKVLCRSGWMCQNRRTFFLKFSLSSNNSAFCCILPEKVSRNPPLPQQQHHHMPDIPQIFSRTLPFVCPTT